MYTCTYDWAGLVILAEFQGNPIRVSDGRRVNSACFHLGPRVNSASGHLGRVNSAFFFYLVKCYIVLVPYVKFLKHITKYVLLLSIRASNDLLLRAFSTSGYHFVSTAIKLNQNQIILNLFLIKPIIKFYVYSIQMHPGHTRRVDTNYTHSIYTIWIHPATWRRSLHGPKIVHPYHSFDV